MLQIALECDVGYPKFKILPGISIPPTPKKIKKPFEKCPRMVSLHNTKKKVVWNPSSTCVCYDGLHVMSRKGVCNHCGFERHYCFLLVPLQALYILRQTGDQEVAIDPSHAPVELQDKVIQTKRIP
jgi:hypothetical protein